MQIRTYHLQGRSAFHLGVRGVGIEATGDCLHADTLFAALCHGLRQQYRLPALQEFLDGFKTPEAPGPPVLLSSAFPYVLARRQEQVDWHVPETSATEQAVRFFPRPLAWPRGIPDAAESRKGVKHIQWVSEGIFRAWVKGEDLGAYWQDGTCLVQDGQVWLTPQELPLVAGWRDEESDEIRLWSVGDVPRVTVDRQRSTSNVYQSGLLRLQPGGGLWLLARWRDDWQARGEMTLRVLGDGGIGGERSSGYGQFDLHDAPPLAPLPKPTPGELFLTLSLYFPTVAELPAVLKVEQASYRLSVRRGWMSSPDEVRVGSETFHGSALRRKAVRMFTEGSLLYWPEGCQALGALADVTPQAFSEHGGHQVWRYGYALPVGYRGGA